MKDVKVLVFDMDGTIADFYGVPNWLDYLKANDTTPYVVAKPLYDTEVLNTVLELLKLSGYKIIVTSWLAKGSPKEYDKAVRKAKINWLKEMNFPADEIHIVKYGTTKANCTRKLGGYQILVDDNATVRKGWNLGSTIDATENIMKALVDLLLE